MFIFTESNSKFIGKYTFVLIRLESVYTNFLSLDDKEVLPTAGVVQKNIRFRLLGLSMRWSVIW